MPIFSSIRNIVYQNYKPGNNFPNLEVSQGWVSEQCNNKEHEGPESKERLWIAEDKDSETAKEYADRLLEIVNKRRLIGEDMPDSGVVEKLLVTFPKRFEAKISALEEIKNLTEITLAEILNA